MTSTIPNVKEQLKNWSGRGPKKDAETPQRETFAERDVEVLGNISRSSFVRTKDGREFKLRGPILAYELERAPDAILVTRLVRDGQGRTRTEAFAGSEVTPGSFAKLTKRKSYTPRKWRPGAIDRDADLRGEEPRQWVALGKDGGSELDIIRGAMTTTKPDVLVTDGRDAPRSVADELAYFKKSGITLALSDDGAYLLVTTTKALTGVARGMLDNRSALYRAHLKGERVCCAWPHKGETPEAITIAVGNAPVCAEHLAGRA